MDTLYITRVCAVTVPGCLHVPSMAYSWLEWGFSEVNGEHALFDFELALVSSASTKALNSWDCQTGTCLTMLPSDIV